jgi:hypothetical protein
MPKLQWPPADRPPGAPAPPLPPPQVTTVIDKSSNKTLGRMPGKRRGKEERALLVQYGLQSAALAAARAGLPRPVLTTKMAVRAFNGARRALARGALGCRCPCWGLVAPNAPNATSSAPAEHPAAPLLCPRSHHQR